MRTDSPNAQAAHGPIQRVCSSVGAWRTKKSLELEPAQRAGVNLTHWLAWFLGCPNRAFDDADQTLAAVLNNARTSQRINNRPVNARQRVVINRLLSDFEGVLSTAKYAKLASGSADTAQRDMRELAERRILLPNPGGGRSTSFRLAGANSIAE